MVKFQIKFVIVKLLKWIASLNYFIIVLGIRSFASHCTSRVKLFDMESLFDQLHPDDKNNKYWSVDYLHFSSLGYDTIGELLYQEILRYSISNNIGDSNLISKSQHQKYCSSWNDVS